MRSLLVLLTALALSGCATYRLVEPRAVTVAEILVVEPQIAWSSVSSGAWETWTVDGFNLQTLQFLKGIADGEPLFGRGGDKRPRFRKDMTPSDVVELVVDSMAEAGGQQVQATGLRPAKLGGADGFRFEWTGTTRRGLERRGFVAGAIVQDRLYLIAYSGVADHYYAKHAGDAERVIQSARRK